MNDRYFYQLLKYFDYSPRGYHRVRKGVKKRLRRHMLDLGCKSITAYLSLIDSDQAVRSACERLMTVSISRFFRDRLLWSHLEETLLPELIRCKKNIRVLSAGCARGEEVYSFKILWDRLKKAYDPIPAMELIAVDVNPDYLAMAAVGKFRKSSFKELPESIRHTYLSVRKRAGFYEIMPGLKQNIVWKTHDLLSGPPAGTYHLVFLRNNILTYMTDDKKPVVFRPFEECLATGGFLIIGARERLPDPTVTLTPDPFLPFVFKKT